MVVKMIVEVMLMWLIYSLYMAIIVGKKGPIGGIFFYPKVMQERKEMEVCKADSICDPACGNSWRIILAYRVDIIKGWLISMYHIEKNTVQETLVIGIYIRMSAFFIN